MTKESLAQQLREVADLVEMGNGTAPIEETIKQMVQNVPPNVESRNAYDIVKMIADYGSSHAKSGVEDAFFDFNFKGEEGPDVDRYVAAVLGTTGRYSTREAVQVFIDSIIEHRGKEAFENCLHDMGWAKTCSVAPDFLKATVSSIAAMPSDDKRKAISCLVKELLCSDGDVATAFSDCLAENNYVSKDSDEFEDLAKEWAEENDWVDTNDTSLSDVAEVRYVSSEVRDFVVEYIQDNL